MVSARLVSTDFTESNGFSGHGHLVNVMMLLVHGHILKRVRIRRKWRVGNGTWNRDTVKHSVYPFPYIFRQTMTYGICQGIELVPAYITHKSSSEIAGPTSSQLVSSVGEVPAVWHVSFPPYYTRTASASLYDRTIHHWRAAKEMTEWMPREIIAQHCHRRLNVCSRSQTAPAGGPKPCRASRVRIHTFH